MTDIANIEEAIRDWRDFLLRCQQLVARDQGITILHIDLAAMRGGPLWWSVDKATVEPAAGASAFAKCLRKDGAGTS